MPAAPMPPPSNLYAQMNDPKRLLEILKLIVKLNRETRGDAGVAVLCRDVCKIKETDDQLYMPLVDHILKIQHFKESQMVCPDSFKGKARQGLQKQEPTRSSPTIRLLRCLKCKSTRGNRVTCVHDGMGMRT